MEYEPMEKMTTFNWLVLKKSIFKGGNLRKRGMFDPSKFPLCLSEEESMDHLLDCYPFSSSLQDRVAIIFYRSDRIRGQPDKNIKEWNFKSFTNSRDGSTGFNTNNLVELEGLIQGLRLVSKEGWFLVTIEGYSKVIIQIVRKIYMGQKVEKVTTGWHLLSKLETLSCLIAT